MPHPVAAAQQSLQTGEQNRKFKRFGKIVVSAGGKAVKHVLGAASRGEHQHGNEILSCAQLAGDREPIFAGKHDIEDDCVEILPLAIVPQKQLQRALAISRNFNRMPLGLEIELQPLGEMGFVFDDEHSAHAVLLGSSKTTVVPRPSPSLSANTRPPCLRAIARTINNPRPVPFTLLKTRLGTR